MSLFRERLYISTTASDADDLAGKYDLGLEIAEFCTASNLDRCFSETDARVREHLSCAGRFTFHAPFNELCPAAIDPLVRELTARRYRQAIEQALRYGIKKIVIHTGFIPIVYYPEWFIPRSVEFWTEFLAGCTDDVEICLENVMEPDPAMLCGIVSGVDDPRLRICLDVGHANAALSHAPVTEWAERVCPWLSHVHIHDNDGKTDQHRPLGQGSIELKTVLDIIETNCGHATYAVENITAAESVDWLRRNGYM